MSTMSWQLRIPCCIGAQHAVQNGEQLSHTGSDGELLWFSGTDESLVERPDRRVAANGTNDRHVQGAAHIGTPAPDAPFSPMLPRITVKWRHTGQRGNGSTVQFAQFGEPCEQRAQGYLAHAGYGVKQLALHQPQLGASHRDRELPVQIGNGAA